MFLKTKQKLSFESYLLNGAIPNFNTNYYSHRDVWEGLFPYSLTITQLLKFDKRKVFILKIRKETENYD